MPSPPLRALGASVQLVDRLIGWHRLPRMIGILLLIVVRSQLRHRNLHDTGVPPADRTEPSPRELRARTVDGTFQRARAAEDGEHRRPLRP